MGTEENPAALLPHWAEPFLRVLVLFMVIFLVDLSMVFLKKVGSIVLGFANFW